MPAGFRILLFGRPRVAEGELVTHVPLGASGAVFAWLALKPGTFVATDELIDLVWADEPPDTARHTIAVHVSSLRAALADHPALRDSIEGSRAGYRLNVSADSVDVVVAQSLARRLSAEHAQSNFDAVVTTHEMLRELWQSPTPFQGLTERFPKFATETHAFSDLHARITALAAAALDASGRREDAMAILRDATERAPADEALWLQLIRCLALSGQRDQALDAYRRAVSALQAAGIGVGEQLRQAQQAVLANDPVLLPRGLPSAPNEEAANATRLLKFAGEYALKMRLPRAAHIDAIDNRRVEIFELLETCERQRRFDVLFSISVAFRGYWLFGGWLMPGVRWLTLGLRSGRGDTEQRLQAHYYVAQLATNLGYWSFAEQHVASAASLAAQRADELFSCWVDLLNAQIACHEGDLERSRSLVLAVRARFDELDDPTGVACSSANLARVDHRQGRVSLAIQEITVARELAQTLGQPRAAAEVALTQAVIEHQTGKRAEAFSTSGEAVNEALESGDRLLLARALIMVAQTHPRPEKADLLLGAAAAMVHSTGARTADDELPQPVNHEIWMQGWLDAVQHGTLANVNRRWVERAL